MFLKEVRLKNLRCFDDLEMSFVQDDGDIRHWTILLGENGAGKSTLLRAIALITAGSDALSELLGDPQSWIGFGKKSCEITATLVTQKDEEREVWLRIDKGDTISQVIRKNAKGLESLDRALAHTRRNYFAAGYGASRRLSSGESGRRKTSAFAHVRARSVASLFDPEATLNPLESWAMDLDYRKQQAGVRTVRKVLGEFLPGVRFGRIDKKNGRLLMKTATGTVALRQLSDGYQNVAAWVGDLLYRVSEAFDDYEAPLKTHGLLMIDELDLHLHPKWQRTLHSFLTKKLPNMQLIVTTHSAVTAQQAKKGELHYLRLLAGSPRLETFGADPQMLLLSQLLMTDAFGLETDESKVVEETKERYRKLKKVKRKSAAQVRKLAQLGAELKQMPDSAAAAGLPNHHAELLRKIDKELAARKS